MTAFFEAMVWGAYLVCLVAGAHMAREFLGWLLRNAPGKPGLYERDERIH